MTPLPLMDTSPEPAITAAVTMELKAIGQLLHLLLQGNGCGDEQARSALYICSPQRAKALQHFC
jgi:hypothetical protein